MARPIQAAVCTCRHFSTTATARLASASSRATLPASSTTPSIASYSPRAARWSVRLPEQQLRFASTSARPEYSSPNPKLKSAYSDRNRSLLLYTTSVILLVSGAAYAAVPLYRVFCSTTGYGGVPTTDSSRFKADRLVPWSGTERRIRVTFNADHSDALPWTFAPLQKEVRVLPGETALAFYTATNHSKEDIIGIATYNVTPAQIAPYFAKVECFCFEEQRLLAGEEVDLPIFFFIDRDFMEDPSMRDIDDVTLSYTFFRAKRDSYGQLVPADATALPDGSFIPQTHRKISA